MVGFDEKIRDAVAQAASQYYRLVVLAGPAGSGKTARLQALAGRSGAVLLNVNLELSKRLLELPRTQRVRHVERLFKELIASTPGDVVFLDNLEILFEPALEVEPLRLLQVSSRNRTVVASWGGPYRDGCLIYAEPGHAEYARLKAAEAIVVTTEQEPSGTKTA